MLPRKAMLETAQAGSAERMKLSLGDDTNVYFSAGCETNTFIQSVLYAKVTEMTPKDRESGAPRIEVVAMVAAMIIVTTTVMTIVKTMRITANTTIEESIEGRFEVHIKEDSGDDSKDS